MYADLTELKPVGGFIKGAAAPAQPSKPPTPQAPVTQPNATAEAAAQPMQQSHAAVALTPSQYERNSLAIKLANNPLTSLADLPEAAAAVLDEPVCPCSILWTHSL